MEGEWRGQTEVGGFRKEDQKKVKDARTETLCCDGEPAHGHCVRRGTSSDTACSVFNAHSYVQGHEGA